MFLRTIQFVTLLLGAYFFGAYVHQNWVAPLPLNISDAAFSEIVRPGVFGAIFKTPVLIGVLEIMLVLLLVLQKKEWKSVSYALTALSFVTIVIMSFINTQTVLGISNNLYAIGTGKELADWSSVKSNWMNYQYTNGVIMVVVCLNLFIGIFISLVNGWKSQLLNEYAMREQVNEAIPDESLTISPAPEPTIG